MKILLLAGWSSAGKDTLGARLVAEHDFVRFAFADSVKDKAAKIYGFERRLADTEEGKRTVLEHVAPHFTVRDALIRYGENEKVAHGKGIWAERLAEKILSLAEDLSGHPLVITDWRFPEELVEIQRILGPRGAEIIPLRVVRASQRISPVASLTEYALCGFPMPTTDAFAPLEDITALLS